MFYIRTDANKIIATGHVMRCMSIADELTARNIDVCFLTADHSSDDLIHERGFKTMCLESQWDNLEKELSTGKIISLLKDDDSIEGIIIDTYYVTEKYLDELHKVCKNIYIDDIFSLNSYPVDFLINYNIYGTDLDYKKRCVSDTQLLLGTKYTPLRKQFQKVKHEFRNSVKNVFISTGGTDNFNIAGKILDSIIKKFNSDSICILDEINFHVISGGMNVNLNYLLDLSKKYENIFVHQNVSNMAEIMTMCDIAVSACGSTMYELCACGVPIITYSFADNQLPGINRFAEKGVAINCGDARRNIELVIDNIVESIIKMSIDKAYRKKIANKVEEIICSNGVKEIVDKIV